MPKHTDELSHNDDNVDEKKENAEGVNDQHTAFDQGSYGFSILRNQNHEFSEIKN